jgi:hypothetical protein
LPDAEPGSAASDAQLDCHLIRSELLAILHLLKQG